MRRVTQHAVNLQNRFWTSSLSECSLAAHHLFGALISLADSAGNCDGSLSEIRKHVASSDRRRKEFTEDKIQGYLCEIEEIGSIKLYEADGKPFIHICGYVEYQSAAYTRCQPVYPGLPAEIDKDQDESETVMTDHDRSCQKEKEKEKEKEKRKEKERGRFAPPCVEDVGTFIAERGYVSVDPQQFVDFYASKGWMVGRNKMTDWEAAVRTWHNRKAGSEPAAMSSKEIRNALIGNPLA